jgi:hypothetical protein
MKKGLSLVCLLLIGFVFTTKSFAVAGCTGKWIDYYGGNSLPIGSVCSEHWWDSDCICGDFKSNPKPATPTLD